PPEIAALRYEEEITRLFAPEPPAFDLILLGMGGDGHRASLFPDSPAIDERVRLVVANQVPQLKAMRITFTLPLINRARAVAFLAIDKSKAEPVRQALEAKSIADRIPATLVAPVAGELHWFLTREAAARLRHKASN
ncbi:MAG: 6-phosphogluconolactonase, partial [Chloroflexi bacterium]|nr:6-phosphogluconolactonase [Chloroflexota bacterium]